MNVRTAKISGALLCVIAMLMCMINSFAISADAADCNVNIVCKRQDAPIANAEWRIYKVGEESANGEYKLTGQFADYPVSLKNLTEASDMQAVANTLENYAELDGLTPVATGVTDENGETTVKTDGAGLYLIIGKRFVSDEMKFIPSPMIIKLTDEQIADGEITVYPKYTIETLPDEDTAEYGVRKTWDMLGQFDKFKPTSITVGIYRDNELVDTVTLDESNNWEHYWIGETKYDWRVKEIDIPENFTVIYENNNTLYQIDNTYTITWNDGDSSSNTDSSSSTPDSSSENSSSPSSDSKGGKLPQTGSLWWPVPVLAGCGIVLLAAGWRVSRKNK